MAPDKKPRTVTENEESSKRLQVTFMVDPDELPEDVKSMLDLDHPNGITEEAFLDAEGTLQLLAQHGQDMDTEVIR